MESNELAWELFTDLASQVRIAGMGGVSGFDFASLNVFFDAYGITEGYRYEYIKKISLVSIIAVELWNKEAKVAAKAKEHRNARRNSQT